MSIKILTFILICAYIINIIYQIKFELPILNKQLKDEKEKLDEKHAQNGTLFSGKRNEDNKLIKLKHKKSFFDFWFFSVIFPVVLLTKIKDLIWK